MLFFFLVVVVLFLNFPFPTFNFLHRGKDAFSSISETIFLKTVEFTTFSVSMISSFFLPRAKQAKGRDLSLWTHIPPIPDLTLEETMKNTGVSFSVVWNAR